MYKAFKYKLLPTRDQELQLAKIADANRWIWNYMLEWNNYKYETIKHFVFKHEMITYIPELKKLNPWLCEVPSQTLQQTCMNLDIAIKHGIKSTFGFPNFKRKHHNNDSFRLPQVIANKKDPHIKPTKKQIKVPKIGWIRWIKYRKLEGKLKSITIKQENGYWWCICLCKIPNVIEIKEITKNDLLGVDLGLTNFAITSEEVKYETRKFYRNREEKLKFLSRKHSKKQKGSKNQEKARKKLNKLYYKIKNQRKDYAHKTSTAIVKQYNFIGVEDLNIKGMIKNKHLTKAISDQGWAMFIQQLEYKTKWKGGMTIKIGQFEPSTKTCSVCGNIQKMPLSQRIYKCSGCELENRQRYKCCN